MTQHIHHAGCGCLAAMSRRRLFGMGAAVGAMALAAPRLTLAQTPSPTYEAMLMNCIDPRFTTWTWSYMSSRGWQNLYSQFSIAGGPVTAAVDSDPFKTWQKAWWDNLAVSIQLHQVKRVVGLCHRDCGAAVLAYGDKIKTDRAFETAKLSEALRALRAEVKKRHGLDSDLGIQDLNGAVEVVT